MKPGDTHCPNGHAIAQVGSYQRTHRGRPYIECKRCIADKRREREHLDPRRAELRSRRDKQARAMAQRRQHESTSTQHAKMSDGCVTERILDLYALKERAATRWERDAIQQQIDLLRQQNQQVSK